MKKLITIIGLLFCSICYAENNAVTVQGGWQHTPNSNYGDGSAWNVRAEKMLYRDVNFGIEYSYHSPTEHYGIGDVSGHSILGEAIYYTPVKVLSSQVYILGGLGWSWWSFSNPSNYTKQADIEINLGNSFAKKVGGGLDYAINNNWSFNLEWNYFQSHVPKEAHYRYNGENSIILTDEDTIGQEETNFVVGVKYRF